MSSSSELSTDDLRTKVFLESNRVKGQHHSRHSGAPRRAFIAELQELSREALIKRYNELFPPVEEVPRTPGFSLQEDTEAWETAKRGPRSLASHPRGAFWTLLIQCSRCLLIESIDARRNGIPGGLQLEPGGKVQVKTSMVTRTHKLICKGCGGTFRITGTMPEGYDRLY